MNHEALGVFSNVDTSVRQHVQLAEITTSADVVQYHAERFSTFSVCDNGWADKFREFAVENEEGNDLVYTRIVGEALNQATQYGFRMMDRHLLLASDYKWTRSPFDLRHQVALITHLAKLNVQASRIKEELSDRFIEQSWRSGIGIWAVDFHNRGGNVTDPRKGNEWEKYFADTARIRFESNRPISLPRYEINAALAAIQFSGKDAERISTSDFYDTVLPEVISALGLSDSGVVFSHNDRITEPECELLPLIAAK